MSTVRHSRRVLLIEDNAGDVRLIKEMLKTSGFDGFVVESASSLAEGLECSSKKSFDAVLLDLMLSDSSGLDTFLKLRATLQDDAAVVVLTGLQDKDLGIRAVRAGAQDYLPKAAMNGELLARSILHAIERHQRNVERESLIAGLKEALAKVRKLSGLLPICARCKKIRDDKGYWKQVEVYIRERSEAEFTHGYCPECAETYLKD